MAQLTISPEATARNCLGLTVWAMTNGALKSVLEAEARCSRSCRRAWSGGSAVEADKSYKTGASVMFDAVYVPG